MTTETKEASVNDEATAAPSSSLCYAVFVRPQGNTWGDPPRLDPLCFGVGNEPSKEQLLRRGRVALFGSREELEAELKRTCEANHGAPWLKEFEFVILECQHYSSGDFCPHGEALGEFCEPCNDEYKQAAEANR